MRYISLFSGIEAASVAWDPLGWELVAFSEIEPFCCDLLEKRYPNAPNLGDISKIDWSDYAGTVDLVVGGSPCFVAGTPVITARGVIAIEEVMVGDLVLTHKGRWRRVLKTGNSISDTIILKGQGVTELECTPEHPILSCEKTLKSTRVNGKSVYIKNISDPSWIEASKMKNRFWFHPTEIEELPIPDFEPSSFTYQKTGEGHLGDFGFNSDFFKFIGMWLGDGWANVHCRKNRKDSQMKRVYLCCAKGEEKDLSDFLSLTGLHWSMSECETTFRFTCSSNQLFDWITSNFGVHADGKTLPGWVFGMKREWRRALLDGYFATDASWKDGKWRSVSINKNLTVGMKILAGTLGLASSVVKTVPKGNKIIDGRKVNERPYFTQTYYENSRSAFFNESGWWGLVRNVTEGGENKTVYNLEVEDDNSYTAAGIAVHNCQAFSTAGNRKGLLDERGRLMFEYIRAVREIHPRWMLWENVPGVFSQSNGDAFETLQGELEKCGYSLAWRTLDAQFFGVAQRRRRVFLVGHARAGCATAVLFERESLRWDYPSSREKREALAEDARRSPNRSYTVITRCGKPGGGKGALVSDDVSLTLSTLNEQTLIQPLVTNGKEMDGQSVTESRGNENPSIDENIDSYANIADEPLDEDSSGKCYSTKTDFLNNKYTAILEDYTHTLDTSNTTGICYSMRLNPPTNSYIGPLEECTHTMDCNNRIETCYCIRNSQTSSHGGNIWEEIAPTMDCCDSDKVFYTKECNESTDKSNNSDSIDFPEHNTDLESQDISNELDTNAFSEEQSVKAKTTYICMADGNSKAAIDENVGGTLKVGGEPPIVAHNGEHTKYVVRRLTPMECERLQGFPDGWTKISDDTKDAPRYKALGNSMAVPVMRWIGKRIEKVDEICKSLDL